MNDYEPIDYDYHEAELERLMIVSRKRWALEQVALIPLGLAIMWGNAKAWWFGVRFEFWCAYYEGKLDRWEVFERWYK